MGSIKSGNAESLGWKLLGRNLGRGGQGDVELVEKLTEPGGKRYALKCLGQRGGLKAHERFRAELEALTRIDHPGIVKVVEYAKKSDPLQYYVMDYVDGAVSLRRRMDDGSNPFHQKPLQAVEGFIQLVEALSACEKIDLTHRDLSPANVLVSDTGRILLIDFGLCHFEDGTRVTLTDEAVGTPHYRSPECSGFSSIPATIKADLYSAGKLLWSMITNKTVFDREKPVFNELSMFRVMPDLKMAWHFHHIFEGTVRQVPQMRFANCARALETANLVRRLIVEGFKPYEELAGGTCTACGVGRLSRPIVTKYNQELNEYYKDLREAVYACWICPYCFHATFVVDAVQKRFTKDRMNLE
jgi:serine/threonine protein kinase